MFVFFFKQKTAYEMRISDWSSDVCSSDLHKLCHTLGGTFDMPHAQTHTAVLPHAIAYNAPSVPEAMERASRALGGGDPATKLYELAVGLGAEMSLASSACPRTASRRPPRWRSEERRGGKEGGGT